MTEKQNIRVLMIGPDRSVHGGISGVVNNLYDAGLDKKVDLTYIGTMREGNKFLKLAVAAKAYLEFSGKLKDTDIVHVNVASDNSFVRKSVFVKKAKKQGKKILIHQHGGEWKDYYNGLSDKAKENVKSVFGMADKFLVLSPYYKDFFEEMTGIRDIMVFPDTIKIHGAPERGYGQKKILFLGRLCEQKGVGELIDAACEIKKDHPDLTLYLAGIWEDEGLKSKAEDNPDLIKIEGWLDEEEKRKLIRDCDIFALPSYFEGQSVSILEAMDGGMCVVASDIGGIPMMVMDNETGILVKPKDKDSLKEGLLKVIDDTELEKRLAENGEKLVREEFDINGSVERLTEIYREMSDEK
ncbi:MAG: glycosyltransferase family 4 protein [Lachnospiraceae bacterium]|nr:glycosyltransferase family 4 protein [Lachnospiraceae bacterium]